jgi:hypothetical protein
MVAGNWFNQDGLYIQYGTQKAVETVGGDYLVYGETREIEMLIPLVPMAMGTGAVQIGAPPTTFSGTGSALAAGLQSLTTQFPLQLTPVTTVSGGVLTFTTTQLFIESAEVDTIIGATGGTSIAVGLVTQTVPVAGSNSSFLQCTPNAGTQILKAFPIARMTTSGQKSTYTIPGATTGLAWDASGTAVAGAGDWLGTAPLLTNALTPLPANAYISTIATGTFTTGLVKVRIKYTLYGNISQ